MGQKSSSHHPDDAHGHAHGGGHGPVEETEEQRRDRERSESVELQWGRRFRLPGLVLAFACGGIFLAWLATLGRSASPMSWAWLLPVAFGFAWGLALAKGGEPEPVEEPSAPAAH